MITNIKRDSFRHQPRLFQGGVFGFNQNEEVFPQIETRISRSPSYGATRAKRGNGVQGLVYTRAFIVDMDYIVVYAQSGD